MTVHPRFVVFAAAIAALAIAPATAQTAAVSLVKPAALASNATAPGAGKSAAGKWTCVSRATVEIAPVSFDTFGEATAWVMVHRVKGEIIAAERISQRQADEVRRMPCGAADSEQGGVLVG